MEYEPDQHKTASDDGCPGVRAAEPVFHGVSEGNDARGEPAQRAVLNESLRDHYRHMTEADRA